MEENSLPQDQAQPVSAPVMEQPKFETEPDNGSRTVPLAAMIEERKRFQRQIDEEKSLRKNYENVLSQLNQGSKNPVDELMAQYDSIYTSKGKDAAEEWFRDLTGSGNLAVQNENHNLLQEIQQKYSDIYAVPEVKNAIDAYLRMDMDTSRSLKEQGFPDAVEYISSIYRSGFEAAARLKNQNESAKSRMGSTVMDAMPSGSSGRTFTRAEIAKMDVDTFIQNEKVIFEQLSQGLIK